MTFVADFTPQALQNASAGRRYGQRKRGAQKTGCEDMTASELERWDAFL